MIKNIAVRPAADLEFFTRLFFPISQAGTNDSRIEYDVLVGYDHTKSRYCLL